MLVLFLYIVVFMCIHCKLNAHCNINYYECFLSLQILGKKVMEMRLVC